jgi:hypothetical protein
MLICTPEEERVRDGMERGVGLEPIPTKGLPIGVVLLLNTYYKRFIIP